MYTQLFCSDSNFIFFVEEPIAKSSDFLLMTMALNSSDIFDEFQMVHSALHKFSPACGYINSEIQEFKQGF
jgi:hypothetical protein